MSELKIKVYPDVTKDSIALLMKLGQIGPCSWCQEVGAVPAKPARDLVPGDRIVYNYGAVSEVVSVHLKGQMVHYRVRMLVTRFDDKGKEYDGKRKATTLIPVIQ